MTKQQLTIRDHKLGSLVKRAREMEERGWACQGKYQKEFQEKSGVTVYVMGMEREYEEV